MISMVNRQKLRWHMTKRMKGSMSATWSWPERAVHAYINCRLLAHQREGIKFLYRLYKNNHGGILGGDMGLGKTITFLAAVYGKDEEYGDSRPVKENQVEQKGPVLIICPTSVIHNWECEFSKWAPFNVSIYHGSSCELILEKLQAIGVGSSGTIMQNKIMELFNLFDWFAPGSLGTREHFLEFYDEPLKHGQRSTAPERFVRVADERTSQRVVIHALSTLSSCNRSMNSSSVGIFENSNRQPERFAKRALVHGCTAGCIDALIAFKMECMDALVPGAWMQCNGAWIQCRGAWMHCRGVWMHFDTL
ncbi:hypothetical protein F3Y22_tig00112857pilonHSYRG00237 [Hibiscus syriacus]|uniref:Helicase ATP-binding domain-containing protein n=1 Tax=Hibiscus syriacus TaxID=106335 RepID=A0A6A2X9X9_HIBSY|nr:hypothetical protein F3Y22_tig00112857pilonHSYRG00237 [Hibiscus syriacus]